MKTDQLIKYLFVLAAVLVTVAYFQGATGLLTTLGNAVGSLFQIVTGTVSVSSASSGTTTSTSTNSAPVIGGNPRKRF